MTLLFYLSLPLYTLKTFESTSGSGFRAFFYRGSFFARDPSFFLFCFFGAIALPGANRIGSLNSQSPRFFLSRLCSSRSPVSFFVRTCFRPLLLFVSCCSTLFRSPSPHIFIYVPTPAFRGHMKHSTPFFYHHLPNCLAHDHSLIPLPPPF